MRRDDGLDTMLDGQAWTELQEAWAPLGLGPRPSETHREYAARLATGPLRQDATVAPGTPDLLARTATTAAWDPDSTSTAAAIDAREQAAALITVAQTRMGRARRVLYAIDPRAPERRLGGIGRQRTARRRRATAVLGPRLSVSRRG